jgi:hypothetical protein
MNSFVNSSLLRNSFVRHHRHLIRFGYSCFDRIICNGFIPQFQHSERGGTIVWFLRQQRQMQTPTRAYFSKISHEYHEWLTAQAQQAGAAIIEPPDVRREDWVEPYYQQLGDRPGVAVILKCREPERMAVHFARSQRVGVERRWVYLYYFYLNHPECGRMFVRLCPYFPFNICLWMNGHNWLACQLQKEGIAFRKCDNVIVDCADPERLQQLADAFGPQDIQTPVAACLKRWLPFFSAAEVQQGCQHQLYMTQMEYCSNLLFHQRVVGERLLDRLMDVNRGLGHPDKLAITFGRPHFQPDTRTGQVLIKITQRRVPVITCTYKKTSIKQYLSNHGALRTESTSYQLKDLAVKKHITNLPRLRQVLLTANERYLNVQQDVLASYVDRGQLQQLRRPSVSGTGRRVPGLHLDDPRLMAVLQAVTCFCYLVGKGCFRTSDLLVDVQKALDNPHYQLSQLRYDLSKLRGKGLLERLPQTQTYRLTAPGYRIALLYLKLYQRLYAPLTAALREPVLDDFRIPAHRRHRLDRLYAAVDRTLKRLADYIAVAA